MAVVVSLINMKGGVGKTTLAAQLALYASSRGIRTLAIDLDPQANLSQTILGQEVYLERLDSQPSINDVVRGYLSPMRSRGSPTRCELAQAVVHRSGLQTSGPDLVPSRLELAVSMKQGGVAPDLLAREVAKIENAYDLILIDCAPTESILTDTAYHASQQLLVPVKPEYLATIGLPLLARSVQEFNRKHRRRLDLTGIVINHATFPSQRNREVSQSIAEVREIARKNRWRVFANEIPHSHSWPRSARSGLPITRTRHVRSKVVFGFQSFAGEFLDVLKLKPTQ